MREAEFGITEMAMSTGVATNGDEQLAVKFYLNPRKDEAASEAEGRPIFKEVEYISISVPGDRSSERNRPARQKDKERFPEHYRRFKAREEQEVMEGTPLSEWPGLTRAQVEEMKFFKILTVEQLAGMSDANTSNIMGMAVLKQKAQKYLEAAKDNAAAEALVKAEARIADLEAKLNTLLEDKPKRRRRTKAELAAENIHEE